MGEYMGISAQKYWQDGTQVENLNSEMPKQVIIWLAFW